MYYKFCDALKFLIKILYYTINLLLEIEIIQMSSHTSRKII